MRLRTILHLAMGVTLLILIFVTLSAVYSTKRSVDDLHTVIEQHMPAIKTLSQSLDLLGKINIAYENFAKTSIISAEETAVYVNRTKSSVCRFAQAVPASRINTDEAMVQLDHIVKWLLETDAMAMENSGKTFCETNKKQMIKSQHALVNLRVILKKCSHDLPPAFEEKNVHLLRDLSNLVNAAEEAISHYYNQEKRALSPLLGLVQEEINKLHELDIYFSYRLSQFHNEDRADLEQLIASLRRYRSAIVLFSDEKELGVAGANLDEIIMHVKQARDDAGFRFQKLNASILNTMEKAQSHIIDSNLLLQKLLVISLISGAFLVFLVLIVFKRVLSNRIGRLIRGAETFSKGDFGYRLDTKPDGDDLSRLAVAFNEMAETLQKRETEKKAYLDQLNKAQKMEAIGLMAGGVAHDLNNILSGIVSYPDLILLQLPDNSDLRHPIETMQKSGVRAAKVVDDLLTIARGVASVKETTSLHMIIQEHLGSPEHKKLLGQFPKVNFSVKLDNKSKNITCSKVHVKKCLMNILHNAFEAIPQEGSCSLTTKFIKLEKEAGQTSHLEPGDYISVMIQDSGPGISDQDIDHIFEPFYTKKKMGKSGTGLGLAIVWNTMLDHKGTATVNSTSEGTVFTLYFPVDGGKVRTNDDPADRKSITGNGERILIVDDQTQLREIAISILQTLNYQPSAVSSGEKAVDYLKENKVDLVLLDMSMEPGMNGCQTYMEIIKLHPGQKAVIASGYSENEEMKTVFKLGVGGFVKKPYSMEQLGLAVKKELHR